MGFACKCWLASHDVVSSPLTSAQRKWFTLVNWIDVTLLSVVGLFGLRGYFRGLFRELSSLVGLLAGFMIAVRYVDAVAALGGYYLESSPLLLQGVAFLGIFFFVFFFFNLSGLLFHYLCKPLLLQTLNRLGGMAVGIGKGGVVTALIVYLAGAASWLPPSMRNKFNEAYLVSPLSRLGDGLIRIGKDKLLPKEPSEA